MTAPLTAQQVIVPFLGGLLVIVTLAVMLFHRLIRNNKAQYEHIKATHAGQLAFFDRYCKALSAELDTKREELARVKKQLRLLIEDRMASDLGAGVMRPLPACDCEPVPPGCLRVYGARLPNGRIRIYDDCDEKVTCYADIRIKNLLLSPPVTE